MVTNPKSLLPIRGPFVLPLWAGHLHLMWRYKYTTMSSTWRLQLNKTKKKLVYTIIKRWIIERCQKKIRLFFLRLGWKSWTSARSSSLIFPVGWTYLVYSSGRFESQRRLYNIATKIYGLQHSRIIISRSIAHFQRDWNGLNKHTHI